MIDNEVMKLAAENRRYVGTVAALYKNMGIDFDELIQIGFIGLVEAAKRYVPSKGVKFISYADSYIRREMRIALSEQSSIIKIPSPEYLKIKKVVRAANYLRVTNRSEPTFEEIAEHAGLTIKAVSAAMRLCDPVLSLNEPCGDDILLIDSVPAPDAPQNNSALYRAILKLSRKERYVLMQSVVHGKTYDEIGKRFNVSRTIIGRIKNQVIEKLRKILKEGN